MLFLVSQKEPISLQLHSSLKMGLGTSRPCFYGVLFLCFQRFGWRGARPGFAENALNKPLLFVSHIFSRFWIGARFLSVLVAFVGGVCVCVCPRVSESIFWVILFVTKLLLIKIPKNIFVWLLGLLCVVLPKRKSPQNFGCVTPKCVILTANAPTSHYAECNYAQGKIFPEKYLWVMQV